MHRSGLLVHGDGSSVEGWARLAGGWLSFVQESHARGMALCAGLVWLAVADARASAKTRWKSLAPGRQRHFGHLALLALDLGPLVRKVARSGPRPVTGG
jgi:hypothetical protein